MTSPLTDFILKLPTVDRRALAKADPVKMAERHGIEPEHAREYIQFELGRTM